jgi:ABC-type lipoprotein release transport system permease subunit
MTSVVIGVWAGTFVTALYWGMSEDRVRIAIENEVSHIQVHHPAFKEDYKVKYSIPLGDTILHALRSNKHIRAYSPRIIAQGMLATTTGSTGILINGVQPVEEDSTTHIGTKIIDGQYLGTKSNQIIVGAKLAKRLKLKVRSKVVLTFLDKEENIASGAFRVAGIFQSNNSGWDETNVFVKKEDLAPLVILSGEVNEIAILLSANRDIDTTLAELKAKLPQYKVESWMEISPETSLIISTMSQFSIIFVVIILLALSFGIVNTMLMAILERTREIGMMIALGMNRAKVFLLVVLETFFLVTLGCPVGIFIAWITISYFARNGIDISVFSGQAMSSFGFGMVMHPTLPTELYFQIIGLVCLTAILSAILPAIKAVRLNPAETIKS